MLNTGLARVKEPPDRCRLLLAHDTQRPFAVVTPRISNRITVTQ